MAHRLLVLLVAAVSTAALADVTATYEIDITPGAMVPAAAVEQMRNGPMKYPMRLRYAVKGERFISGYADITAIGSLTSEEMLILDKAHTSYAETTYSEWLKAGESQAGNMTPEARELLSQMKFDASSKVSGKTRLIHGISSDETTALVGILLPIPESAPPSTPKRMEMRPSIWNAVPKALQSGGPHLRELTAAMTRMTANFNPAKTLTSMFDGIPGMMESIKQFTDLFSKPGSVLLELNGGMFIPGIAEAAKESGAPVPAGVDLNGPLMEMAMMLKAITAEPIAESEFTVPKGFVKVEAAEILSGLNKQAKPKP